MHIKKSKKEDEKTFCCFQSCSELKFSVFSFQSCNIQKYMQFKHFGVFPILFLSIIFNDVLW